MTLDLLDTAFVDHWASLPAAALSAQGPRPSPPPAAEPGAEHPTEPGLGARLLAAAWREWNDLAAVVETARQRGRRVIGIAGSEPAEGRTQLVECLAAALRARGRDVICVPPSELSAAGEDIPGGGLPHDKRIVLVDAGVWFPPGPIRRARLAVASLGCDAAILVRKADGRGGVAREAALEALGIEVLGEVLTFTAAGHESDPSTADASRCGHEGGAA